MQSTVLLAAGRRIAFEVALSAGIAAGGNAAQLFGVSFEVEEDDALLAAARQKAFADAHAKAELYAAESGRTLGQVVSVTETMPGQGLEEGFLFGRASPESAVPIESGREPLAVTVTVEWSFR